MTGVKTPDERGHPAAAWIVAARETLGLSDSQVVEMLGKYDEATLRKAEAHSKDLSGPMWRALVPLYQRLAIEQNKTLPAPPSFKERPARQEHSDLAALVTALAHQTAAINALVGLSAQAQRELVAEVVSATLAPFWEDVRELRLLVSSLRPPS